MKLRTLRNAKTLGNFSSVPDDPEEKWIIRKWCVQLLQAPAKANLEVCMYDRSEQKYIVFIKVVHKSSNKLHEVREYINGRWLKFL